MHSTSPASHFAQQRAPASPAVSPERLTSSPAPDSSDARDTSLASGRSPDGLRTVYILPAARAADSATSTARPAPTLPLAAQAMTGRVARQFPSDFQINTAPLLDVVTAAPGAHIVLSSQPAAPAQAPAQAPVTVTTARDLAGELDAPIEITWTFKGDHVPDPDRPGAMIPVMYCEESDEEGDEEAPLASPTPGTPLAHAARSEAPASPSESSRSPVKRKQPDDGLEQPASVARPVGPAPALASPTDRASPPPSEKSPRQD